MRRITTAALVLALAGALAAPAGAHQGDPRFDSVLTGAGTTGLQVQVLNNGDRLEIRNRTGTTVTVEGYESEPYARLLGDGTVQVNDRSPATYLNEDPYADVPVPDRADAKADPRWRTVSHAGLLETHDHRIHWMSRGTVPRAVSDTGKRTKVFDWSVPVRVGERQAAITGTLWWRGDPGGGGGMPVGAIAALVALVAASGILVAVVRRRRRFVAAR
jgi:hypothetical protein